MAAIPATQEVEIRRIMVQGHPQAKSYQAPISTNKLGIVVHTWQSKLSERHRWKEHGLRLVWAKSGEITSLKN
jgi:hypothetical protein